MHWSTRCALLLLLALFVWLNFEYTRASYDENSTIGWRGGVRFGFPLIAWDAGQEAVASIDGKTVDLQTNPYGGVQYLGLLGDLLALAAAAFVVACASEPLARRFLIRASAAADKKPARTLHAGVYVSVALIFGALVWANVDVDTRIVELGAGRIDFRQEMGWPLPVYQASHPNLKALRAKTPKLTKDQALDYLDTSPDAWFMQTHWFMERIVLNVVIGLALIGVVAGGIHFFTRRSVELSAPVVVPLGSSD